MPSKRTRVVVACVAAGVVVILSTAPTAAAGRGCRHRGEHVIKRSTAVEVVSKQAPGDGTIDASESYLCRYSTKTRITLYSAEPGAAEAGDFENVTVATMRLAGLYAAYEDELTSSDTGTSALVLRSFVARHREHVIDGSGTGAASDPAIVLKASGSVGYVGSPSKPGVFVCQPVGCGGRSGYAGFHPPGLAGGAQPRRLAPAPDPPASLHGTRGGIGWTLGGHPMNARLT